MGADIYEGREVDRAAVADAVISERQAGAELQVSRSALQRANTALEEAREQVPQEAVATCRSRPS
jgi:histone H3/H4